MESSAALRRPVRRRHAVLLLPAAALLLGTAVTAVVAQSRATPYAGVYRQEAVAVVAARSGRILSVQSRHGDAVTPGTPLLMLGEVCDPASIAALRRRATALEQRIVATSAQIALDASERSDAIAKEMLDLRLRCADLLRTRLDVQVRRRALEGQRAADVPVAADEDGFVKPVSARTVTERRLALCDVSNHEEVLNTQVALCETRLAELGAQQKELVARLEESRGLAGLRAELASTWEAIKDADAEGGELAVVSPAYGQVGIYRHSAGEFAAAGETLVEVFDSQRPYVLLSVPISELTELAPGRKVRVEFEGIETRKALYGVVAEIASEAERCADAARQAGAVGAEVRVRPTGRLWPVPRVGTTAHIYLDAPESRKATDVQ